MYLFGEVLLVIHGLAGEGEKVDLAEHGAAPVLALHQLQLEVHLALEHVRHVDDAHGQRLVAEYRAVLVLLPALHHDLQRVALPLEEVRVLQREGEVQLRVEQPRVGQRDLVGAQRPLGALHLDRDQDRVEVRGVEAAEDGEAGDGEAAQARDAVGRRPLHLPGREQLHGHGLAAPRQVAARPAPAHHAVVSGVRQPGHQARPAHSGDRHDEA